LQWELAREPPRGDGIRWGGRCRRADGRRHWRCARGRLRCQRRVCWRCTRSGLARRQQQRRAAADAHTHEGPALHLGLTRGPPWLDRAPDARRRHGAAPAWLPPTPRLRAESLHRIVDLHSAEVLPSHNAVAWIAPRGIDCDAMRITARCIPGVVRRLCCQDQQHSRVCQRYLRNSSAYILDSVRRCQFGSCTDGGKQT